MNNIVFWVIFSLLLLHCKSNEISGVMDDEENITAIVHARDTVIHKKTIYRGDTLITLIKIKGDTIIERVTSKYADPDSEEISDVELMSRGRMTKAMPSKAMSEAMAVSDAPSRKPGTPRDRIRPDIPENPQAGQITAGEWNDLTNWDDWTSLLNDNDYNSMQDRWGIHPTERYSVFVTNNENVPLVDLKVELRAGDEVVWLTRTDNGGKAELWSGIFKKERRAKTALSAKIYHNGDTYDLDVQSGKSANLKIKTNCKNAKNVDIMFVVDATGSMGDEINYLKSEVKDVIEKSIKETGELNLRIGSVFYRDMNDQYLTKVSPLSKDLDRVYKFINDQKASGGGDYPEAVDAALEEALAQQWTDDAIARIIFLLLDAPPHEAAEVKTSIRDQIAEAAERGIKIIPVSASGINRETEFLLKFMSIATNGTYVFITDDSGIGNAHLDPLVDDYEVEKLNDLLIRLISNYTKSNGCNEQAVLNEKVKIYPNPTSNFINVESDFQFDEIRIVSNSGKVVHKQKKTSENMQIDLSFLVDGVYTLQCIASDYQYSQLVIVVRA